MDMDAIKSALAALFAEIIAFVKAIFTKEVPEVEELLK